jgi:hypothetical protein
MKKETLDLIFQIVAAVGSLATFGAFIFLFRRDKDKQTQIDRLTGIAEILKSQNDTWKEHNLLVEQQVDIFRNTSILRQGDNEAFQKLHEIEEKKLKLSVKPYLWLNGATMYGHSGELKVDLNNKGERAKLLEFDLKSDDIILHSQHLPYDLEKDSSRFIFGRSLGKKDIQNCEYEIDVIYADKLENKYLSKIKGRGFDVKLVSTKLKN